MDKKTANKLDELVHAYGGSLREPITRLEWWNYYFFQWFFIRICWRRVITSFRLDYTSILRDFDGFPGKAGMGYSIDTFHKQYGLLIGAYPLSGWSDKPYRYIFKSAKYIWFKAKKVQK